MVGGGGALREVLTEYFDLCPFLSKRPSSEGSHVAKERSGSVCVIVNGPCFSFQAKIANTV